jgi:diguanylate cyclase (GGDEF)-like protein/PAS domain S-box-containing protein
MPLPEEPTTDDAWSLLLGAAADAAPVAMLVQDRTGAVRAANAAARSLADAYAALEDQPAAVALATGAAQHDRVVRVGGDRHLRVDAVPLFAAGRPRPFGVLSTLVDVTPYLDAVTQREGELALLAAGAGDLIARHGPDGRIVHAAGGAQALLGLDPAQLVGFWAADVCHPDDAPRLRESHERSRRGEAHTISYRVRRVTDGREIWLESTVQPRFAEDGTFVEAITTSRDVTERERDHALLSEAQDMAHLGSWSFDIETGELTWSDGLFRIFGLEPCDAPSVADHDRLVHPDDAGLVRDALARAARDGEPFDHIYRLTRPDGAERIMHGRGARAERDGGHVRRVWGTTQDVTDHHDAEQRRRDAEARFRTAFEHAPIGICIVAMRGERPGQWLSVNPAMGELLGYDRDELLRRPLREAIHPEDRWISRSSLTTLARGDEERLSVECRLLHRDGHVLWTLVTAAAVRDEHGKPGHCVLQVVDITERKRVEGQLQHLADHDALTGLLNRRRFSGELDRVLAEAERYARPGAVLVLDLDGFKYVNDTLGHRAGDELIARLAATLRAELRETDVIARLGGDEFGVILPECSADEAGVVSGKLLRAIERDGVVADQVRHARVTASIGLATFDGADGVSGEELLVEADIAMYDAKEGGRNRAAAHERAEPGPGRHVSRLSWLERIRRALADDDFELFAQPIIALAGDDEPAFELLLRMRSDGGELVPPATFLPIAERFDLVQDIDRWVVERAVALVRREHEAGAPLTLSVNLSGRTMGDAAFAGWLEALLSDAPVPPGRLIFEITETAAIVNVERARALAATLRRFGCRLALDDFGAGFASFNYLKHLRFDVLKIDGEFVRGLRENPTDRLVVEAVVAIARGLGTPSLAEFVMDSATLDAVRALGVDYAQGFHLGRPAPVEEALALARSGTGQAAFRS